MPAAGLHPNSLHGLRMRLKVPCALWAAGGILGFGTADWLFCLHLHRDLAVMSGWLCCCFLQDLIHFFDSLAHKLPSRVEHGLLGVVFCVVCFVFVLWCFLFLCCLFSLFLRKFVSSMGYNQHWCDLTFIELSVVKLDYGKVSAVGISGCDNTLLISGAA